MSSMTVEQPNESLPPALPGFENISRYWDKKQGMYAAKILPGEYYVTRHPNEAVVTVLGSCISACIRDRRLSIGGMNHFMLPVSMSAIASNSTGNIERYGSFAMESLINQILSRGGLRKNLEVKITGGGKVLSIASNIGEQNIEFVKKFLEEEQLNLLAEDVGGLHPRKVYYVPSTGRLRVKKLHETINQTISQRETAYAEEMARESARTEVELF